MIKNKFKNFINLIFVVLFSASSIASTISDYDGTAFMTKSEFDSLKNNYQNQIDYYKGTIDDKIDNAIASYVAGLTVEKVVNEKFLGEGHGTRRFVRNFALENTNRVGDYVEGYSAVGLTGCNNDQTYNTTGYFNMVLVTFDTSYAAQPAKTSQGTYKDMFLYIQDSTWDSAYKVSTSQLECVPYTAWFGYFTGHSSYPTSNGFTKPADFTIERSGSTVWGYQSGSMTINAGGRNYTCSPNSVFISLDNVKEENVLSCLAGSTVPSTNLYTLHIDDKSKLGNASTYVPIDKGWRRIRYNGSHPYDSSNNWLGNYRLKTYHHDYKNTYALSDLIVDTLSATVNSAVKYYNGLPLFKASQDGMVTFKLKLVNDGGEVSKVAIKPGQFDNVAFAEGISLDSNVAEWKVDDVKTWPSSFNSDQEYKIEMEVKKGSTYYMKVLPNTTAHDTVVNIVGEMKNVAIE